MLVGRQLWLLFLGLLIIGLATAEEETGEEEKEDVVSGDKEEGDSDEDADIVADDGEDDDDDIDDEGIPVSPPAGDMIGMVMGRRNDSDSEDDEDEFEDAEGRYEDARGRDSLYMGFLGIPYAVPPIGAQRFVDPVELQPWSDVLDAREFRAMCPQQDDTRGAIMGSEDCLFINVFTPRIPSRVDRRPLPSSLIPVMVYIHGGDFISGSGQIDPKPLVQKGVVVVSMNYRLGPLGFLNLQNQYVTGNQGLKDQLMALQWVSQNIHAFGGDNTKVTIFGEGAGGASVHLHLLSPLGEGLYRNGISQSGNALSRMIEGRRRGVTATEAVRYLDHTECNLGGDVEVVECLQGKTVSNLYDNPISVGDEAAEGRKGSAPFRHIPTIDYFADVSFMPQHPYITMKTGNQKDLPFIIGITKHDGGYRLRKVWDELVEEGEDWESYGPHRLLDVPYDKISDYDKLLAQVVRHFYMGPKEMKPDPDNSKALMQMFTDAVYRSPTNKILELLDEERVSHLFSYEITHKPSKSHLQDFEVVARAADDKDEEFAVVHGDDLLFLFDNVKEHLQGAVKTEDDKRTRKALVKMWTNFAKYEDPTPYRNPNMPPWDPYDKTTRAYLAIGPKPKQMTKSHNAAMYFWERMYWQDLDLTFVKNLSRVSPLNKPATTAGLNYIESRANQLKNQLQNSQTQAQNQVAQSRAAVPHQPGQQQRLQDPSALNYYNGLQPISYNSFLLPHNQFQYYKQMTNAQGVQK